MFLLLQWLGKRKLYKVKFYTRCRMLFCVCVVQYLHIHLLCIEMILFHSKYWVLLLQSLQQQSLSKDAKILLEEMLIYVAGAGFTFHQHPWSPFGPEAYFAPLDISQSPFHICFISRQATRLALSQQNPLENGTGRVQHPATELQATPENLGYRQAILR